VIKMKKENKNFLYNIIYQIFLYIIPLVTVPYISRILGVENIGIYSYTYSIVYYFMLGTMLGINNYGARNIAKLSKDKEKMSEKFCSIYYLQLILGIIMLISYNLLIFNIYNQYRTISLIQNIFLISSILDINWLYFGLEEFKITVSRNIIIKLLSLILIYIFVKTPNDLWIYTLIMSGSTLLSQLYLWIFAKKYINLKKVSIHSIFANLKGCLVLFIPVIAYGIYRVMDKTMIGMLSSTSELGIYESAEKIINIPVGIITALGTVMLPSMSKLDENAIRKKIISSFELCFFIILPISFGLFLISKDFSILFFGKEFTKTGLIIKLLIPTIIFSGVANVIRTNYLIPNEKDNIYINSTICGAVINLIMNLLLIKRYGAFGACMGTIAAEFSVMLYQILCVRNNIDFKKILKLFLKYAIRSIIMSIFIIIFEFIIDNIFIKIITQLIIGIIIYMSLNYNYIIFDFFGKSNK